MLKRETNGTGSLMLYLNIFNLTLRQKISNEVMLLS